MSASTTSTGPSARPVALVTGGGSGIGAATATRLLADRFDVVITGRRQHRLDATVALLDGGVGSVRAVVIDVSDLHSVTAAVTQIGRCDVLVNNACGALGTDPVETGRPGAVARHVRQ